MENAICFMGSVAVFVVSVFTQRDAARIRKRKNGYARLRWD